MGIDVHNKRVSINHAHDNLVVTCPTKNPTKSVVAGMPIQYIYRRVMAARGKKGDGNPFIYSLKRMLYYSISTGEIKKLVPGFKEILRKTLSGHDYDLIVPMPSGHKIGSIISTRILRHIKTGSIASDLFRKKTNAEVLISIRAFKEANPEKFARHKTEVINLMQRLEEQLNSFVSMKTIDTSIRHFVQPLALNYTPTITANKILIVDDLVSTGTTLLSARDQLQAIYPDAQIDAVCLLSEVTRP